MVRDPAVRPLGRARQAPQQSRERAPEGHERNERRSGRAGRGAAPVGRDEVPRCAALGRGQVGQQRIGVRGSERDRAQPPTAVERQELGERPAAETAIAVVDDCPLPVDSRALRLGVRASCCD